MSEIALALKTHVPVIGIGTWELDGIEGAGEAAEAVERALAVAVPGGIECSAPRRP